MIINFYLSFLGGIIKIGHQHNSTHDILFNMDNNMLQLTSRFYCNGVIGICLPYLKV